MENLSFDPYQFFKPSARPVTADSQISWSDFKAMHLEKHKPSGERRWPTPAWSVNDLKLRALLVVYMEARLKIRDPRGTLIERRERVRTMAIAQRPRLAATLTELNQEYVATEDRARKKKLQEQIENVDTLLRYTANGGIDTVAAVVYLYHRCRLDSVAVAGELRLKPPHCRQILWKLDHLWARRFNEDGTEKERAPIVRRNYGGGRPPLLFDRTSALEMRKLGMSYNAIARRLKVSTCSVWSALKKLDQQK